MSKNLLTIVIPTKDEDETLRNLLCCLADQTVSDFTIIVADNSNTDIVKNICREKEILCIAGGLPGKGRNNGAKIAESLYILFLDADVYIPNNFVEDALKIFKEKNADGMSFGFIPNSSNWLLKMLHAQLKYFFLIATKLGWAHGIGGAILVKLEAHISIGGFDETVMIGEDCEYVKRLSKNFRYHFTLHPTVTIDVRRMQKDGTWKIARKLFLVQLHRIFIGEIRHKKIKYF